MNVLNLIKSALIARIEKSNQRRAAAAQLGMLRKSGGISGSRENPAKAERRAQLKKIGRRQLLRLTRRGYAIKRTALVTDKVGERAFDAR